jgi:hypothetical protein
MGNTVWMACSTAGSRSIGKLIGENSRMAMEMNDATCCAISGRRAMASPYPTAAPDRATRRMAGTTAALGCSAKSNRAAATTRARTVPGSCARSQNVTSAAGVASRGTGRVLR